MKSILFILLSTILITIPAQSAVWETHYQWNDAWEQQFSRWVNAEWDQFIFSDPDSKYYGIPTDCADASYGMRAVSYTHLTLPTICSV